MLRRRRAFVRDADACRMEFCHGLRGVEEDTARFPHTGDTKTRHGLEAVGEAKTVHHRHWPGVNLAVLHRRGYGAWYHLIQHDATAFHVEVKRLSMKIRDATYSEYHTSLPCIVKIPLKMFLTSVRSGSDCREPILRRQARGVHTVGGTSATKLVYNRTWTSTTPHVGTAQPWNKWTFAAMKS